MLLLRHDVDLSLDYACDMARAESDEGFKSSYFILPFNDFYNPLSPSGRRQIRMLHDLGHEVGLHWDSSLYPSEAEPLERAFRRDVALLEDIVGAPVTSASQHVPIDTPMVNVEQFIENEAYSETIRRRFTYVSDSSMRWREHTPLDLVARRIEIQFLAHPIWWFATGSSMAEKVRRLAPRAESRSRDLAEDFIAYVERCLADREALDARYESMRQDKEAI